MYNTTIFDNIYFLPLFVTFEVTALIGKRCFLKNSNEFKLFIYWSNFSTAEVWQTLILVKKALLEQTLSSMLFFIKEDWVYYDVISLELCTVKCTPMYSRVLLAIITWVFVRLNKGWRKHSKLFPGIPNGRGSTIYNFKAIIANSFSPLPKHLTILSENSNKKKLQCTQVHTVNY